VAEVSSAVLAGISQLEQQRTQIIDLRSQLHGFDDPGRMAGDPDAILGLAGAHRQAASGLRTVQQDGGALASRMAAGGLWEGAASDGFSQTYSDLHTRIGTLADQHDGLATSLDGIAGDVRDLNADATTTLGAVDTWLMAAEALIAVASVASALLGMDTGEISGLLGRGRILITDLDQLRWNLDRLGPRIATQVSGADLGFSFPTIQVPGIPRRPGPTIDLPIPRLPNIRTAKPDEPPRRPPGGPDIPPIVIGPDGRPRPSPIPGGGERPPRSPAPPEPRKGPPQDPGIVIGAPPRHPHPDHPQVDAPGVDVTVPIFTGVVLITVLIERAKQRIGAGKKGDGEKGGGDKGGGEKGGGDKGGGDKGGGGKGPAA
jgi:uncharacterized protein YukE